MNQDDRSGSPPEIMPRVGSYPAKEKSMRPSRRALEAALLCALYANLREHAAEFIETLRTRRPDCYLRAVLTVLPKETEKPASATDALGGEDLEALVAGARRSLALFGSVRAGTAELDRNQSAEEIPSVP